MRNRQGNLFLFCCLSLLLVGCLHLDKLPAEQGEVPSPSSGASTEPIPLLAEQGEVPSPSSGASIEPTPIPSPTPVPRTITKAELSTFAGSGVKGFKDGTAQEAMFENPLRLVKDLEGNLYVGDSDSDFDFGSDITRLRKIDSKGNVVSIAGSRVITPLWYFSSNVRDMDITINNHLLLSTYSSLTIHSFAPYHQDVVLFNQDITLEDQQKNTTYIRSSIPDSVIPYPGMGIENLTVDKKGHLLINHHLLRVVDAKSGFRKFDSNLIIELSPTYQFISTIKPRPLTDVSPNSSISWIRNIFVNNKNELFIAAGPVEPRYEAADINFYQLDRNGIATPIKILNFHQSVTSEDFLRRFFAYGSNNIVVDQYDQIYCASSISCEGNGKSGAIIKGSWQERNGETGLYFTPIIACPDMAKLFDVPPLISEESYGGEVGPRDIAVDPQGENLYFSDAVSHTIKRIHLSYE